MLGPALLKKKKNQTWIKWSLRKTTMGGWIGLLSHVPIPVLGTCEYVTSYGRRVLRWDYPALSGWAQCNHGSPSKGDAKGSESEGEDVRAGADVRDEKMLCPWPSRRRKGPTGPRAKECEWPLQASTERKLILPESLQEEGRPPDTF